MADYDFSTINSSDFEELVCDLINEKLKEEKTGIILRTFKDGKDKGIDLLYSTFVNKFEIVGQIKHYYRSGYLALISKLKNEELEKVKKLNPNRYIFATSIDLSIHNIEEIQNIFDPYIKILSDIYGKKDLNKMLEYYPNVLDNNFKLWFSSNYILKKILHYEIEGRTNEFKELELKKRLRLYVPTPTFSKAREFLKRNNFIIITGEPGSGKTTTAELLLYDLIKNDYELIYIYDDIKETEVFLTNDNKKQVFYFDDFLGHNSVEMSKAKGSETALLKILRRISNLKNKKIIFTTRTFILNTAVGESENLRRFNIKAKESIILLSEYNKNIKVCLLRNQIEESQLKKELKDVILREKNQNFITSHRNFSPRSVEFITGKNVEDFSANEYEKFIIDNFNYPDEIWRHAYEQQINDLDRFLLNTLLSFGDNVTIHDLEIAFNSRLDYEVERNNYTKPMSSFRTSFMRLEGGFIVQETHNIYLYKFINPSLVDFLLKYLKNNYDEITRIGESAFYLKQLTTRLYPLTFDRNAKSYISKSLKNKLLEESDYFIKSKTFDSDIIGLIILIYYYVDDGHADQKIRQLIQKVQDWSVLTTDYVLKVNFIDFMKNLNSKTTIDSISSTSILFAYLIIVETDLYDLIEQLDFYTLKFNLDTENLFNSNPIYNFEEHFSIMLNEMIDQDIDELLTYTLPQDFYDEYYIKTKNIQIKLLEFGLNTKADFYKYGNSFDEDNYIEN